jgi:hypothetical protein|tara:strand:- start:1468 stop:1863 length:396 start_codon:yes stop_codon:yes gene_type:complete
LNALWTKDRSHKRVFFDFCFLDYAFAADSLVSPLCSSLFQTNNTKTERKPSAKMSSSTAMYASLSILSLCALTGTGVAIGSGVGMMSMAALEAEKKQTNVAAHSVKEKSWVESKQVSGSSAQRGFAAAGRQ